MSSVDYKHLRNSSKLLSSKKHNVQKTFYGHLFSSFPLSFQLDNFALKEMKNDLPKVKKLPCEKEPEAVPLGEVRLKEKVEKGSKVVDKEVMDTQAQQKLLRGMLKNEFDAIRREAKASEKEKNNQEK